MKALYQFTRKNLVFYKHRTIVTMIGVMLTSVLLFSLGFLFTIYQNQEMEKAISETGNYHFAYTEVDSSILERLKNHKDIKKIEVEEKRNQFKISMFDVTLYARNQFEMSNLVLLKGTYPKQKGEIVLSDSIARFYEKEIGQNIQIEQEEYEIVGLYEAQVGRLDLSIYTYLENPSGTLNLYMILNSTEQAYETIHNISKSLDFQLTSMFSRIETYEHESIHHKILMQNGQYQDYLDFAVKALMLMILLTVLSIVCILVIYNSFAISVTERKKLLGILASIGATPRQLLKSVFYEATIIALISIPLGLLISWLGMHFIVFLANHFLYEIFTIPLHVSMNAIFFLICLIFIIISVYLSAFFPAMRAREVTPVEAIKQVGDIKLNKKRIKSGKWVRKLFGIEGEIAYKNRKRNKKKYRIVNLSLIIGIVLFMTFSAYLDLQKKIISNNEESLDYTKVIRLQLFGAKEKQKKYLNNLLTGIDHYKMERIQNAFAKIQNVDDIIYTESFLKNTHMSHDRLQIVSLGEDEFKIYAKKIGVIGDKPILLNQVRRPIGRGENDTILDQKIDVFKHIPMISFTLDSDEQYWIEIEDFDMTTISNYEDDYYMAPRLFVEESLYEAWISKIEDTEQYQDLATISYTIDTNSYREVQKNYQNLKAENALLVKSYYNEPYSDYLDYLHLNVWNIAVLVGICFIALIAITSMMNTIHTSMQLRKKEFAMLRSVGMTSKQFYKMISLESVFFGIKSLVWGLLISTGLIYLIYETLNIGVSAEEKVSYPYPYRYMWITITAVFVIIFIAMLYSNRNMKKNNIVDTLKEDN